MADPAVSVIVPVYRDWGLVPVLLDRLAAQTVPDFEVVLVDNGLESDLPDLHMSALRVHVVQCAQPGSYAARNLGAAHASGRLLAFTDADCQPQPQWIAALVAQDDGARLIAGPVVIRPDAEPNRWAIFDTVRGMRQDRFVTRNYAVTANLAVPADVFRELGGFDAGRLSGGDAEFCRRAVAQGHRLILAPEAITYHPARASREMLETKARRIKGGQVAAGPLRRRVIWTIRSLVPPVREMLAYALSPYPLSWRLTACAVRMQLWGCELRELVRLILFRNRPERR